MGPRSAGGETGITTDPRFDHGEDLQVVLCRDGRIEFRDDSLGEFVRAETVVYVEDEC